MRGYLVDPARIICLFQRLSHASFDRGVPQSAESSVYLLLLFRSESPAVLTGTAAGYGITDYMVITAWEGERVFFVCAYAAVMCTVGCFAVFHVRTQAGICWHRPGGRAAGVGDAVGRNVRPPPPHKSPSKGPLGWKEASEPVLLARQPRLGARATPSVS